MADYSGTPLPRKLGIKEGSKLALIDAPQGFEGTLGRLPQATAVSRDGPGPFDVILLFAKRRDALERRFEALARKLEPNGGFWIAWPKKASGVETDIDQSAVMEIGLASGLVDNKVAAVDETWSGLRFVVRKENRGEWTPAR